MISMAKPMTFRVQSKLQGNSLKAGQGDDGYIAGAVTELSLPVVRRVMCYHRLTGLLLDTTWSKADGSYRFDGLIAGVKYFITSVDQNNDAIQYNAVTQDLIVASEVVR